MIVAIDIPSRYVNILSAWASVSRTLDTARFGLGFAAEKAEDESERENFQHCENEIEQIQRSLDELHQTVRGQIWRTNRGELSGLEKFGLYCCVRGQHGEGSYRVTECYNEFKSDETFIRLVSRIL